jgi:DNA processing protein
MSPLSLPRLISMAGGAGELWDLIAGKSPALERSVGAERMELWRSACREAEPARVLRGLEERGIRVILPEDGALPVGLWSIYDPPALLFATGREVDARAPFVAVVGARKASGYGRRSALFLASQLAQCGVVVVSGAAYGIDGHAHRGCLEAGGFTVAVLGCGIDRVYPPAHAQLLERIKENGCLLSEYAPGEEPLPWRFPHRNRLIAGLSQAVGVVEACEKSGALITAEFALEEGREVMAVPGPIDSPLSRGTHALIQKGAKLVTGVEDVLEELQGLRREPPRAGTAAACAPNGEQGGLQATERALLALLGDGAKSLDSMVEATGAPPGEILASLTSLVLRGWVAEEPGGRYGVIRHLGGLAQEPFSM